jgi:TonB family protein
VVPLPALDRPAAWRASVADPRPTTPMAPAPTPATVDVAPPAIARPALDAAPGVRPAAWLAGVWAGGAGVGLAVLFAGAWRLRRIAATSARATDPRWSAALAEAIAAEGIVRHVDLRVATAAALVATWGWRRPVIVVPVEAMAWSDERVAAVLAHELAHVRRHDWAVQWLAETVRALLWWNPLAWLACRALRDDSELACDDAVLDTGIVATEYAGHLLAIARAANRSAVATVPVTPMARPSTLERRIVVMLDTTRDHRVPTRRVIAGAVLALAGLLAPVAVLGGAQAARQPLEGVVYDPTGAVLPGVAMTLVTGTSSEKTTTDAAGHFTFGVVDPGKHTIQAEVPGFGKLQQPIDLKQDADWTRAIMLSMGEVRETIVVRSRRPVAPAPIASGPTPVRVGGNVRAPRKLKNVSPTYPERMRDAGLEAAVKVEAVIGIDGSVTNARVVSASIHPDFAIAAIDAVRQWQFEPTLLNGKPVAVVMTVSIDFGLE